MAEQGPFEGEVLESVGHDRRTFVKRLVAGTAFAIPVVSSFDMQSLRMSSASAQISYGVPLAYFVLEPTRVLDTRTGSPLGPGATLPFHFDGALGSQAVKINVTVTNPTAPGYLQVKAAGSVYTPAQFNTSVINFAAGQTVANEITVVFDDDEDIEIKNGSVGSTHVIVDWVGAFAFFGP